MKPWPEEYYPITPALRELQRRYPWPDERPNVPFDRRRLFGPPQMRAMMDMLPSWPTLVLEIGSFLGASLRLMMEANPAAFFIAVDPLTGSIESETDPTVSAPIRDVLMSNCWPYRDRLVIVPDTSDRALAELGHLGIAPAVAYIDGAHDYASVKADIEGCYALNPDMILFGDDYGHLEYDGLRLAVRDAGRALGRKPICLYDYLWALQPIRSGQVDARPGAAIVDARQEALVNDSHPRLPLRLNQEFILLQQELASYTDRPPTPFNVFRGFRLSGPIDVPCLEQALNQTVLRHTALRTTMFRNPDVPLGERAVQLRAVADTGRFAPGTYVQAVLNSAPVRIAHHSTPGSAVWCRVRSAALHVFDPSNPPLIRADLLSVAPDDHVLMLAVSHLVCDRWSMDVVGRDLLAYYRSAHDHVPVALPEVDVQFSDFGRMEQERLDAGGFDAALRYWTEVWQPNAGDQIRLTELQPHGPPTSAAEPSAVHVFAIDEDAAQRIRALARTARATAQMFFKTCAMVALCRLTGKSRLLLAGNFANRARATAASVGWFQNRHATRLDLAAVCSGREALDAVRRSVLAAMTHESVPAMALWNHLEHRMDPPGEYVPITFDYIVDEAQQTWHGLGDRNIPDALLTLRKASLDILVREVDRHFDVAIYYAPTLLTPATIAALADCMRDTIAGLATQPGARVTV